MYSNKHMTRDTKNEAQYELIIIGGGPAGMMAAGRAASLGARVLLLEKNPNLGKKLLISGGGRSNITNAEFDTKKLLEKYGISKKFLYSAFAQFSVKDTFTFFESLGMKIKIEAENRAFPASDTARSVLEALEKFMKQGKVSIECQSEVVDITSDNGMYTVYLENKKTHKAPAIVLSTGGLSHPETGSTGEGFQFLRKLGAPVGSGNAALVPIITKEKWGHSLSGLAFTDAKISLFIDGKIQNKKQGVKIGKILFTHVGLSGPAILNMSMAIGEALEQGMVTLGIDIFPKDNVPSLDKKLRELLQENLNKKLKNILKEFIPASLVEVALEQNAIDGTREANDLHREERIKLCMWLKNITITPTKLMGKDKAIISSGGVSLADVDTRTMEVKNHCGLYVVGDVLDVDRPSGGYSLQLCWTTGWVAGTHAGKK